VRENPSWGEAKSRMMWTCPMEAAGFYGVHAP
jgi:hypothetical protein